MAPAFLIGEEPASTNPQALSSTTKSELSQEPPKVVNDSQLLLGLLKAGATVTFDKSFDWNKAAADIGVESGSALEKQWSRIKDSNDGLQPLCQIITPIGMVGYGFDPELTREALRALADTPTPTALILDSGSTDSGPEKLALGGMTCPRSAYERDLGLLLEIANEFHVPIIISSAGGDGTNAHVDEFVNIIEEASALPGNESYNFKTLAIYSNISKSTVQKSFKAEEIVGCGVAVPKLTESDIEDAVTIVAQMGPEPFVDAMEAQPDFDVIIGGRSYDPSPYTAFAIHNAKLAQGSSAKLTDAQIGGFTHMGKLMECGAQCATPKSQTALATVYLDGTFDVKPISEGVICTPSSVAAHTLYEKTRPDLLAGPGGILDLTKTKYEALADGKSVRVCGGHFSWLKDSNLPYRIKLEAARVKGYRSIFMGGFRDPILIAQLDTLLDSVKAFVSQVNSQSAGQFELGFHAYGKDGIMGTLEPGDPSYIPREVFLVGEVLATTQAIATSVASSARVACVHGSYAGQRATSGNFAFGIGGKSVIELGACAEFCIYHLMPIEAGTEGAYRIESTDDLPTVGSQVFSWSVKQIGKAEEPSITNGNGPTTVTRPKKTKSPKSIPQFTVNSRLETLADIAPVIRSKNSGPYEITIDVIFSSASIYNLVKASGLLSPTLIATLYHMKEDEIIWSGFFDQAMAFKATIPRRLLVERTGEDGKKTKSLEHFVSGGYMETDVHASQQYVGLLTLPLSKELRVGMSELLAKALA